METNNFLNTEEGIKEFPLFFRFLLKHEQNESSSLKGNEKKMRVRLKRSKPVSTFVIPSEYE